MNRLMESYMNDYAAPSDETSEETLKRQMQAASDALTQQADADIEVIETRLNEAFDEFNFMICKPDDERQATVAELKDLRRFKDLSPWHGDEAVNFEIVEAPLQHRFHYNVESRRYATRLCSHLLVGLVHARVQTFVSQITLRFFPQDDSNPPIFEVEILLGTIMGVKPGSVVEDPTGAPVETFTCDEALSWNDEEPQG